MCGIAGFTQFNKQIGDSSTLDRMGKAIYHRGPDAGGEYLDEHVGLCHRRLSILDLSSAGNQPMFSSDERYVIVFNGEIYNFQELREDLENQGCVFQTGTDTEVLLALYAVYGENVVDHIGGMFAFAIWDKQKQSLFLARDRLGKKPLYYYPGKDSFVFASELKAILTFSDIPKEIRPDALYDFFAYQYVPDPKTIFKNIYKLEPGYTLTLTRDGMQKKQYWDVSFGLKGSTSNEHVRDQLLGLIDKSVKQRMISDVPLGAFLSGGVDSSGVVGLMAKNSKKPVVTCSIGFDSKEYDEVVFAKEIAEQFGTDHHEFTVRKSVEDNLKHIVGFFDEPFSDPSLVPTFFVSELARQKVTVALAGDGGDESFAGYSKYAVDATENKLRQAFPLFIRRSVFPLIAKLFSFSKKQIARKAHTLLTTLSHSPAYGFYLTNSFFKENMWKSLVREEFSNQLAGYHPSSVTLDAYEKSNAPDHLGRILYTDIKTYLPGDILVKGDRMSMANSLEVRAPLLDYNVVEYAATIPSELKLKGADKKHILKQAFSSFLSRDTLYRKKMGFSVPLAQWLREEIKPLAEKAILSSEHGLKDYFKEEEIYRVWQEHQSKTFDHSAELWSMLMFQLWFDKYMVDQ